MDWFIMLNLYFDCRQLLSHLHVHIDIRADEARLSYECLLDAYYFKCTVYIIDDWTVLGLMREFDAAPDQVALTDLLQDVGWRGIRLLGHYTLELRLDAVA